jgi:hypothetical protein
MSESLEVLSENIQADNISQIMRFSKEIETAFLHIIFDNKQTQVNNIMIKGTNVKNIEIFLGSYDESEG